MDAMVLPYELFDDGSIDCRNFMVTSIDGEESYPCEWDHVKAKFPAYEDVIRMAVADHKDYINVKDVDGHEYELSWD